MNKLPTIPSTFEIARHKIKVEIVESLADNEYGNFDHVKKLIHIAKNVNDIILTDLQMYNSFLHELIHVCQFFYNNAFDEAQAQTFANFISEYELTKSYE